MVLAIRSLGGSNAGKEAVNNNVLASNYFNFFQAKNMRQTSLMLAADELEYGWLNDPAIGESTAGDAGQARPVPQDRRALRIRAGHPRGQEGADGARARV